MSLVSPAGDCLSIGVGRDESVLGWTGASLDPPYFASKGTIESVEPVVMFFAEGDHWTEFPRHEAILWARAVEGVRRFLETGELPDNVDWQEI